MRKRTLIKLTLAGGIALGGVLSSILPAQAAGVTCYSPSDNGTLATGVCTGVTSTYVQLNVSCPAIWPWTPWIDYGSWVLVDRTVYVTNSHVSCGLPVTLSYQFR